MIVTHEQLKNHTEKVAVVGLGYVGLPLALLLARHFSVVGFDVNTKKITDFKQGIDETKEVDPVALQSTSMVFSSDLADLRGVKFFILAIPTPIDAQFNPDLHLLERASEMIGSVLSPGAVVVYESTVYPGVTEDICAPILEKASGLQCGKDFFLGYSPERVNPGDKNHRIDTIVKVVSGMDEQTLDVVAGVYEAICQAGVHRATSIKVAEAAKAIENAQRDLNVAFMNELAFLFHRIGIPTRDVLAAAGTKWNFLPFSPGLVGGHCIGVDPYYLAHLAKNVGYHPRVILAGREINEGVTRFIADELVAHMNTFGIQPSDVRVTLLGVTFKENIPDVRNSKAAELAKILVGMGAAVSVFDPHADARLVEEEYGLHLVNKDTCDNAKAHVVILATAHEQFRSWGPEWIQTLFGDGQKLFMDVRNCFSKDIFEKEGIGYWSL